MHTCIIYHTLFGIYHSGISVAVFLGRQSDLQAVYQYITDISLTLMEVNIIYVIITNVNARASGWMACCQGPLLLTWFNFNPNMDK